jgi:transposase-like protein
MSEDRLCCKRCGGAGYVKSGLARGHQRYRCRGCGFHFTDTPLRGKPAAMKALAVLLYGMGNMSFSMIGRLLGVSDVAVLKWVRAEASALPEPEVSAQVVTIEVDEMWHFVKKSLPSCGSGAPLTLIHGALWPGFWVGVMMQPVAACSTRSD